jgi:hypothetical protein
MMTAQEVFDKVAVHLLTQRQQCIDDEGTCRYRYGGLKCAAGVLIEDSEYRPAMEGRTWPTLGRYYPDLIDRVGHGALVSRLQGIHDACSTWWGGTVKQRLIELARARGLSTESINHLQEIGTTCDVK